MRSHLAPLRLVYGGYDGADVCNDITIFADGLWTPRKALGATPSSRAMHAACMLGDHLVVFGGWGGGQTLRGDTCMLDVPHLCWLSASNAPLALRNGPSARQGHSLLAVGGDAPASPVEAFGAPQTFEVISPAGPRPPSAPMATELLLFGGETLDKVSDELWSLRPMKPRQAASGSVARTPESSEPVVYGWQLLSTAGTRPAARSGHAACMLSRTHMLVCGGRGEGGGCVSDDGQDWHVLHVDTWHWSTPELRGDVPRPRWGAACCVLPALTVTGAARLVLDGGRDVEGWVEEHVLVDLHSAHDSTTSSDEEGGSGNDGGALRFCCRSIGPRQKSSLSSAADDDDGEGGQPSQADMDAQQLFLSGHSITILPSGGGGGSAADGGTPDGGEAYVIGGSLADGELPAVARRLRPEVVRWLRPDPGPEGYTKPPSKRDTPQLLPELTGPPLLASTFTATRCGQCVLSPATASPVPRTPCRPVCAAPCVPPPSANPCRTHVRAVALRASHRLILLSRRPSASPSSPARALADAGISTSSAGIGRRAAPSSNTAAAFASPSCTCRRSPGAPSTSRSSTGKRPSSSAATPP